MEKNTNVTLKKIKDHLIKEIKTNKNMVHGKAKYGIQYLCFAMPEIKMSKDREN